jgi:aspartate/methionine/tyrosine aminotransferase
MNARRYFTVSSSGIAEKLAALAVRQREVIYGRARRIAQTNLQLADRLFSGHADILQWIRPAGGMTAFPWLTNGMDARQFCRIVAQRGVLLVPGDCFGYPAHFRVGFAASGEQFPRAIERLSAILDEVIPRQREATMHGG